VLYHAKDIWPRFIACVLVVTDRLIAERPTLLEGVIDVPLAPEAR
jgi:ABC-type nitrate/sulfonate/bicarbonate transport system substrate-binding protein